MTLAQPIQCRLASDGHICRGLFVSLGGDEAVRLLEAAGVTEVGSSSDGSERQGVTITGRC